MPQAQADGFSPFLQRLGAIFQFSADRARRLITDFHRQMRLGLAGTPESLQMLPTYCPLPTGNETGTFLALDMGGTNLRVLSVHMDGKGGIGHGRINQHAIPDNVMTGTADSLFGFIAARIREFALQHLSHERRYRLGFTFSFPVEQHSLASGRLIAWTKGFTAGGVAGRDVVSLLQAAMRRQGLYHVHITALLNDTTGTMARQRYHDPDCDMGVILGTGTNACYAEHCNRIANIAKATGKMIINMEWGNFNGIKQTKYDQRVDASTPNSGSQLFEKMVSGMYLGELVRIVISDMASKGLVFNAAQRPEVFFTPHAFTAAHVSAVLADTSQTMDGTSSLLDSLGNKDYSLWDMQALGTVCRLAASRAARLAATAMAAVVTWMDPDLSATHTIAIDGSLFEKMPGFARNISAMLQELLVVQARQIRLQPAKDGSGIGAAVVAATTHKPKEDTR